jgi:hypothetical protein
VFNNILTGFRNKEEVNYKASWEQTRQLMYVSLLPHQKTNTQGKVIDPLKLSDVLPLPWDKELKVKSTVQNKDKLEQSKVFWDRVDKTAP